MKHIRKHGQEGIALLTAVIFIAVATLGLVALTLRAVTQNRQVVQYVDFRNCFQGLEAGYAMSKADLETGGTGMIGLGTWAPSGTPPALPSFDDAGIAPLQIPTMPGVEYMAYVTDWSNDGVDNNGNGAIDELDEDWVYTVDALARNGPVDRHVEAVLDGFDVNVWRNAIFGGTGQAGGLVNGNVSIHGSVHLLGNDLPAGGIAVNALDLSGTSLIHNNYASLAAHLSARVPPLPTRLWNGEVVETLGAVLRVRNGLVGTSGNSEIGQPDNPGDQWKETMDGTFVNDGWTGNSVIDDGGRGDPTHVYSDNGWDMPYDLGDRVPLPILSDDWRDMYTGARVLNGATGLNYTHEEYFHDNLAGTPYPGDMLIECNQDFYYNATRPLDPDPANRQSNDDYIYFQAASNLMEINGQIEINGNLEFTRGGGNDKTIHYTGRAAILAHGDVTINTDLLTVNSDGTTDDSFPANNIIGIMASNNMTVGSLSQLEIMGAFYAQNQLRSEKQTTVMGTFVSNYFDMGTNVPDIYQVPELADNLPFGMIGAYPILIYAQVSWREIGL